ncbi:putative ribokinase [Ophidiomyces ophidiicola]|nr:putative ribokinase [Ophidiomyces ophidiicola]
MATTTTTRENADADGILIETRTSDGITTIGINRPHRKNAINPPTAKKLYEAFLDFESDPQQKVCVLHGVGGTFSAGFDLSELIEWDRPAPMSRATSDDRCTQRSDSITRSKFRPVKGRNAGPLGPSRMQISKPVICAVSGHCVAGGLELSLIADMRVVEDDVVFGVFSRRFGIPLLDGGTVRLPAVIGLGRAMDITLTGRPVGAHEAFHMGLANRLVPKGQAYQEAMKLAELLVSFPQECLNADRDSCYYAAYHAQSLEDALSYEFEGGVKVADLAIRDALKFVRGKRQSKL